MVQAFDLADGRRVVAKTRPYQPRLMACLVVHRLLWGHAFPCSEPLSDVLVDDDKAVTFESYVHDGPALDTGPSDSASSAMALARLVDIAAGAAVTTSALHPPVPWVWWDHDQDGLWPLPDDLPIDLNDMKGPPSLDEAAEKLRQRLYRYEPGPLIIGHGDWEAQNVFWQTGELHAVHDWDSLVARPEPFIVGPAAAVHGVRGRPSGRPTVDDMRAFMNAYSEARNLSWTTDDRQACLAAGLWVHIFNAKKAASAGGGAGVLADPYLQQILAMVGTVGG